MVIDTKYHPVITQIIDLLEKNQYWFETFEHEPVRTSEEAAKIRDGYSLHQGTKALIVRLKITNNNKRFIMLVIPGDMRFDNDEIIKYLSAKDLRFATEDEVSNLTKGVQPGGVPPFGNLFGIEVYVDPTLLLNEKIVFNAGDKSFSVAMKSADYKKLVNPQVVSIT